MILVLSAKRCPSWQMAVILHFATVVLSTPTLQKLVFGMLQWLFFSSVTFPRRNNTKQNRYGVLGFIVVNLTDCVRAHSSVLNSQVHLRKLKLMDLISPIRSRLKYSNWMKGTWQSFVFFMIHSFKNSWRTTATAS